MNSTTARTRPVLTSNGGPLNAETGREKFTLYQWDGRGMQPEIKITDHASIIRASQGFSGGTFSSAGFYWDETEGYQILTNILEDPLEWNITAALSINNDGWILASGTPRFEPNGASSWLLLRPIPEPSSLVLLAGVATLLLRRQR